MVHQLEGTDELATKDLASLRDGGVLDDAADMRFAGQVGSLWHVPFGDLANRKFAVDGRMVPVSHIPGRQDVRTLVLLHFGTDTVRASVSKI